MTRRFGSVNAPPCLAGPLGSCVMLSRDCHDRVQERLCLCLEKVHVQCFMKDGDRFKPQGSRAASQQHSSVVKEHPQQLSDSGT